MNVKARKCARAQSSPTTTTPVVVGYGIEFTIVCRWCALWVGAGANECGCHWGNIACRYQHDRNTWRTRIFTNDVMEYEKWFGIMSDKDKTGEARKSFSFIQCGKLLPMERRIRTQNKNVPQSSGRAPLQSFFHFFLWKIDEVSFFIKVTSWAGRRGFFAFSWMKMRGEKSERWRFAMLSCFHDVVLSAMRFQFSLESRISLKFLRHPSWSKTVRTMDGSDKIMQSHLTINSHASNGLFSPKINRRFVPSPRSNACSGCGSSCVLLRSSSSSSCFVLPSRVIHSAHWK